MRTPCSVAIAALCLAAAAPAARAQGSEGVGLGVGVESSLTGISGPAVVYQAPNFHVHGILGLFDTDGRTQIDLAGRFFWKLHSTAASDFGLGGGLGIRNIDNDPGESDTQLHLELGAQIRAFVTANVALGATLGLGFDNGEGDDDLTLLDGQLVGAIGLTYFFF
jgi:hypothetical protein